MIETTLTIQTNFNSPPDSLPTYIAVSCRTNPTKRFNVAAVSAGRIVLEGHMTRERVVELRDKLTALLDATLE